MFIEERNKGLMKQLNRKDPIDWLNQGFRTFFINSNKKVKTEEYIAVSVWFDSLFFPSADSGDVSSIKDVATLELLADRRPTISS